MKKNGINFILQDQKFHQGVYCFVCGKKIEKGEKENISDCSPYMHLCIECACSNVNIPAKKGASIKYNNRIYMWVSKGIRGNHICDLTKKEIKNGTPCWWSSKKEDPQGKTDSYVLEFEFENPNEFEKNEKLIIKDDIYGNRLNEKEEIEDLPWDTESSKPISEVHLERDVNSFFEQVYGERYKETIKIFTKKTNEPYINIFEYVNEIIPKGDVKKYFIFWQDRSISSGSVILITNRDKIFQQVKFLGVDNAQKPISEIKILLSDLIFERYENIEGRWLRRD